MDIKSMSGIIGAIVGVALARYWFPGGGIVPAIIGGAVGGGVIGGLIALIFEIFDKFKRSSKNKLVGLSDNEVAVAAELPVSISQNNESPVYSGFGGWLYIYTIIQFYSLYTVIKSLKENYNLIVSEDILPVYRSAGYSDIADKFAIFGLYGMFFAISIIVIILISWYFAIRTSRYYKSTNIILYVWNLSGTIILYGLYMYTINYMNVELDVSEPIYDSSMTRVLIGTFIGTMIWIPYFIKSERVKYTFIR